MTQTHLQRSLSLTKRLLPSWIWVPLRSLGTALIGPILFAHRTGYWRSALRRAAVSKNNRPIPWYTYPSIDFLKYRNYDNKAVLEFGGGQSTLWWAERAKHVVTMEGDQEWYEKIKGTMPDNVDLFYVSMESKETNVSQVKDLLNKKGCEQYDVIVIDGLYRFEMIDIAISYLEEDGIIVCDNAEGYGFYEGFKNSGLGRVDFFGNAPGVILPHSTSIYFNPTSFVFKATYPIPVISKEA